MVDDIKSLTKKCADLEKRLKFAEAKIKVVADSMTNAKDIEKYLDVLQKKMQADMNKGIEVSEKAQMREFDVSQKGLDARERDREKEYQQQQKENKKFRKEMDELAKKNVRQAEFNILQNRITTLEALVAGALRR